MEAPTVEPEAAPGLTGNPTTLAPLRATMTLPARPPVLPTVPMATRRPYRTHPSAPEADTPTRSTSPTTTRPTGEPGTTSTDSGGSTAGRHSNLAHCSTRPSRPHDAAPNATRDSTMSPSAPPRPTAQATPGVPNRAIPPVTPQRATRRAHPWATSRGLRQATQRTPHPIQAPHRGQTPHPLPAAIDPSGTRFPPTTRSCITSAGWP